MTEDIHTGERAIVAKRAAEGPIGTAEIEALARASGYEVADAVTQVRREDPGTHLGRGKAAELAALVDETGARTVVVDGELTPSQTNELRKAMPRGTSVSDRYRLVLGIFATQANTRRAKLQVELARLRYDLPRMEEDADEGWFNKRVEKGSPIYDVRDRIDDLERKLNDLPDPTEAFRERRRESGFDLVTLAGYTNAGKSTLLHRLADDLDLAGAEPDHPDEDPVAAIEDRLFKTLETTTRRATLEGRPTLVTDTVGFVADLPHWLVESFSETLSEAAAADAVVLVADASDPVEEFRERVRVSLDVLSAQGVEPDRVIPALNKVDLLTGEELARRREAVSDLVSDPIEVSVIEGTNLDDLIGGIRASLPTRRIECAMPNCDGAMRAVSWAYDHAEVETVAYDGGEVRLVAAGRPDVIERLSARVGEIGTGRRPP